MGPVVVNAVVKLNMGPRWDVNLTVVYNKVKINTKKGKTNKPNNWTVSSEVVHLLVK